MTEQKWTKEPWIRGGSGWLRPCPPWISSGVWVETYPECGGPDPQPPEGEQIGDFDLDVDAERAVACVNALAGIADPAEHRRIYDEMVAVLTDICLEDGHYGKVSNENVREGYRHPRPHRQGEDVKHRRTKPRKHRPHPSRYCRSRCPYCSSNRTHKMRPGRVGDED